MGCFSIRFTGTGFVWDSNSQAIPIQDISAWAPFQPTKDPNSETRVLFNHYNKWSSNWTTSSSSEAYKFICEVLDYFYTNIIMIYKKLTVMISMYVCEFSGRAENK
jgi:hypothetical protein